MEVSSWCDLRNIVHLDVPSAEVTQGTHAYDAEERRAARYCADMLHETDEGHVLCPDHRPTRRRATLFDREHYLLLADAFRRAADDALVHVIVVTGTGTVFSAGQDLKEMAAMMSGELVADGPHGFPALLTILEEIDKPVIAAVNGAGAGVGMTMLLHCDIVLVADTACLRVPFVEMGVPPEAASSVLMPQALGWQRPWSSCSPRGGSTQPKPSRSVWPWRWSPWPI